MTTPTYRTVTYTSPRDAAERTTIVRDLGDGRYLVPLLGGTDTIDVRKGHGGGEGPEDAGLEAEIVRRNLVHADRGHTGRHPSLPGAWTGLAAALERGDS